MCNQLTHQLQEGADKSPFFCEKKFYVVGFVIRIGQYLVRLLLYNDVVNRAN